MIAREAVLAAFDRLFDKAATKLGVACDEREKEEAKQRFAERYATTLDAVAQVRMTQIPEDVIQAMEEAIDGLSPAQVVAHLAAIPLVHQAQEVLRTIAYRAAQQRLLDHLITQADDRYGGN